MLRRLAEPELLGSLFSTKNYSIFSAESLQMRNRGRSLWQRDYWTARRLIERIIQTNVNPLAEAFLLGVADVIEPKHLLEVSGNKFGLLCSFVELRPDLASDKNIWPKSLDAQRELLDHVGKSQQLGKEIVGPVIAALLDAHTDSIAEDVYKYFRSTAIHPILDWFNKHATDWNAVLPLSWQRLLSKEPKECLNWLSTAANPNFKTIALVASKVDPHSKETELFGTQLWLKLLESIDRQLDRETRSSLAEFLLPISFKNIGPNSEKLAVFSFLPVHDALSRDALNYDSWRRLEPLLPTVSWYKLWDKCERLRLGLINAFVRYHWSANAFLRCAPDVHLFRQLINTANGTSEGRSLLSRVWSDILQGTTSASPDQRSLLEMSQSRKWEHRGSPIKGPPVKKAQ